MNHRTLMSDQHSIAFPKSMAVYDRYLYFIDSRYDHLVRVNAEDGSNMEEILENDPDLKSLTVFSKKSSELAGARYSGCFRARVHIFSTVDVCARLRFESSVFGDEERRLPTVLHTQRQREQSVRVLGGLQERAGHQMHAAHVVRGRVASGPGQRVQSQRHAGRDRSHIGAR